jgi:hypothetical protein
LKVLLDGRAGCSKTFVLYPVIGALQKANEIVLVSASSAFAAKNYPGGQTTHYLYGIPVDEYNPFLESTIHSNTQRGRLLLAVKCHVIDEISSLHFKAFDCADRLLRSLAQHPDQIWGGKMLITLGDFRQNAPVVHYGDCTSITKALIRTQPIFSHFEILCLHTSIRQSNDPEFAQFLNSIGDDCEHDSVNMDRFPHTNPVEAVLNFVFPPDIIAQPLLCLQRAILSPYNTFVDDFNAQILHHLSGLPTTYYSADYIEGDDENIGNSIATPDLLNSLDEPGIL